MLMASDGSPPRGGGLTASVVGADERDADLDDVLPGAVHCVAVGTDPTGRRHRIIVRPLGDSFVMVDSRRRCRVNAHWSRRLNDQDIQSEIAFVFRIDVNSLEYPAPPGATPQPKERTKRRRTARWASWARKTLCKRPDSVGEC